MDTAKPEDTPKPPDVKQIKTMLDLPDTASDVDLITALVTLVANLQQKYEAVLADALALEQSNTDLKNRAAADAETLADNDLKGYEDVITPDTRDFWKGQIIANRSGALAILNNVRTQKKAAEKAPDALPPTNDDPAGALANRAAEDTKHAAAIANRATELRNADKKLTWIAAFRKATTELNNKEQK